MSTDHFSSMPASVRCVFCPLWQEVQNIHRAWKVNRQLFGTSAERVALLNRFGGPVFGLFQHLLLEHVNLAIFRLLDPSTQRGGKDQNLSLERLANELQTDGRSCGTTLVNLLTQLRSDMAPYEDQRNKVSAHNDFYTTPTLYDGTSSVQLPSRETIEKVLARVRAFMNCVQNDYGEGESYYIDARFPEHGDGETLIGHLTTFAAQMHSSLEE